MTAPQNPERLWATAYQHAGVGLLVASEDRDNDGLHVDGRPSEYVRKDVADDLLARIRQSLSLRVLECRHIGDDCHADGLEEAIALLERTVGK